MLFNSINFLIFFPIVLLIYFVVPPKLKNLWLLISSYYFYMCWNAKYIFLILISTVITYISGILLEKIKNLSNCEDAYKKKYKNIVVGVSLLANLGILFYFKYVNFAVGLFDKILNMVDIQISISAFDILLPVGISFYTFQALSYTMDVYRGDIYAEKNFINYALFVSFFPQLVAGPIERSKNLLKQLSSYKPFDFKRTQEGVLLMLWGYFLKIVVADRIAIFVDTVYGDFHTYSGWYLIVATILFAVQIYCDFSGYSIIAVGTAKILGITLMENFNAPYLSTSVAEFWRKWHISLTSWFKDYLYIPLGGSRKGKYRKYINKMIVFLTSGLWHGAKFSFIVWGGMNGLYQIIGEITEPIRKKGLILLHLKDDSVGHKVFKCIATFVLVDFAWIFFRANRFYDAIEIIKMIFTSKNPWILFDGSLYKCGLDIKNFNLMIISIIFLMVIDYIKLRGITVRNVILKQSALFKIFFFSVSILFLLIFGKYGSTYDAASFIYFQF